MDIISSLSNSTTLVRRLREISKNVAEAEFKNLLADLSSELADVKLEAAALKEMVATLQEENRVLKATTPDKEDKPIGTNGGATSLKMMTVFIVPAAGTHSVRK
jgi:hypothetical protein